MVVSNRVPDLSPSTGSRTKSVGGLVSALLPALEETGGLWFGWSGQTSETAESDPVERWQVGPLELVTSSLTEDELNDFYFGYCNRALWPLLHSLPERVATNAVQREVYYRINRRFAHRLIAELRPGDRVWVHDYHLIPLGNELRRLGWEGPVGFFLHIPFAPPDIYFILPRSRQLLEDLTAYDLVGFHTEQYAENLRQALDQEIDGKWTEQGFHHGDRCVEIGVFPIGTTPELFASAAESGEGRSMVQALRRGPTPRKLILGVDRLDYTKGIAERLQAFRRLLENYPHWRGRVSLLQVSVPSRTQVPEYQQQKEEVERLVGEINGRFSEPDWIPIHYLYRAFSQRALAALYRSADVCLVTPLRDGMNLVAKEYVASQSEDDPGALVLSRFCGAASELRSALLVNPHDLDEVASALDRALVLPLDDRRERHEQMIRAVRYQTANRWRQDFLSRLEKIAARGEMHEREQGAG